MAFQQLHVEVLVVRAAEAAVERGGHDDDGDFGAALAQLDGDLGAELAGAQVVVEYRDVDAVERGVGLLDGGGGDRGVAVLAQDGAAQVQVDGIVIEQQNVDPWGGDEF